MIEPQHGDKIPDYRGLSIKDLQKMIGEMHEQERRKPNQSVVIHTGLGGAQTFEFIMKQEYGIIPRGKHSHSRLLYRLPGEYKVVDDRSEIWMWSISGGHVMYKSTGQAWIKGHQRPNARFTMWIESVEKGELTPTPRMFLLSDDQIDYWRQRYNRKHKR